TLPELLQEQGYATAIIGKWHLGNQDMFQPLNHGFDTWYGTPASNSQGFDPVIKKYAEDCVWREGYTRESILKLPEAKCPLIRDNVVIEAPADQTKFTQRYTREAVRFITEHKDKPFFLYLPHNMVHIPLQASADFVGKSKLGIYGDAVQELDWSTGVILKTLRELGLDESTLVIFTSDNGPHLGQGGSAGPLRGAKGSTYEGGVRVPLIARWPGNIPAGRATDEPITIMDLLPTLVKLAGGTVPADRVIDGKDIWPVMAGAEGAKSPHEAIYYLSGRSVQAIRVSDWKFRRAVAKAGSRTKGNRPAEAQRNGKQTTTALYNLRDDVGEQINLAEQQPAIAARLNKQLDTFTAEFRKTLRQAGTAE
ncbi:MAG: sulfatase-like hydrolase/transferase, partial [Planctomycetales bacterium]|nr:sulfatase-like hydrolase/transferase [Planctomycetales bacterium]